jgi:hypothetical protein
MSIDKYLDNITSEHRDKPNFIGWLSKSLNIIDHTYLTIKSIDSNFDIDYAIGAQLDVLGTIIGRNRTLTFQPLHGFTPVLSDEYYRLVLKTKIALNNWDGTIPEIYKIWDNIFGSDDDLDLQIEDNQDMSFNAYITGYVDQIQQDLIQHGYIIPKPEGVRINYVGRSKVPFNVYSAMVVSGCQTQVITMDLDQSEYIKFTEYPVMVVQQIKTETIKLYTEKFNYITNENYSYITNENGDKLIF